MLESGAKAEFKEEVSKVIDQKVQSRDFMANVMKSEYMKEYKIIQQRQMITVMLNSNDSSRVKFSAKLSAKTGLTIDALVDSLSARVHENNLTKKEVIELIRLYNRQMVRL
jgi:hypothetical protein